MRKIAFLLALMMSFIGLQAQEYYINLHQSGQVIYQNNVSGINNMNIQGSPASLYINGVSTFPISAFDSITFVLQEPPQPGDAVIITYNGNTATVSNPYPDIDVTTNGADVTVYSSMAGASYLVEGSSSNGSLTIYSNSAFSLTLGFLNLTSNTTAAINLASPVDVDLTVQGICTIADGANSAVNGALYAAGNLIVGPGDNLRVTGNAKHGILVDGDLTVNDGNIDILDSDSDGIHVNGTLNWNSGYLYIPAAGSDGLDVSGNVTIQNGDLQISTTAESQRGIKVSGIFTMDDGHLGISCTGYDGKGIKADSLLFINGGNIEIEHTGDVSKGIKCDQDITINGGTISITSSGSTVVTDYDPAYCTAIKGDQDITITGGDITITLPTSNHGGKGISCAGNMTISGDNTINIETHGDGASYNTTSGTDTYSSACLRAETNMQILGGTITLSSTGKGGKGIKVGTKTGNTYSGTYTQGNPDGSGPTLTITTTGTQVVSGGGGGGWPPGGGSSASGSAKAIKVGGTATIYGGTTTVNTSQKGAEGLESKTQINIEGGQHYFKCYDDCINSKGKITFNGGVTVCFSNGNDAVDSNAGTAGAITIGNGVVFAYTTKG
ncbi:MAG: carbohydrate-binding domain-containing protein, partial [Prevotella sp.]|nr:carbohydrate-binding domain-containing protein [Prevotella sp.]